MPIPISYESPKPEKPKERGVEWPVVVFLLGTLLICTSGVVALAVAWWHR